MISFKYGSPGDSGTKRYQIRSDNYHPIFNGWTYIDIFFAFKQQSTATEQYHVFFNDRDTSRDLILDQSGLLFWKENNFWKHWKLRLTFWAYTSQQKNSFPFTVYHRKDPLRSMILQTDPKAVDGWEIDFVFWAFTQPQTGYISVNVIII